MGDFDRVIKDGIVIDGTRSQRYRADVGIRSGRIAALGRLKTNDARRTLDASGMIVAPGFIDLHTHYDAQLFWDPYLTLSGWHGVTSVVIGNCGFGFAPMRPEMRERAMLTMTLAERNHGFMQMALATTDGAHDFAHIEQLAEVSGRPILYNVVQSFVRFPEAHRGLIGWLDSCRQRGIRVYGQGVTTTAAFTFTFEDWNLFDDDPAWVEATVGTVAERKQKLADPGRRSRLRGYDSGIVTVPIGRTVVLDCFTPETKPFENLTVAEVAARTGKHPVDAMLDVAVADDLRTVFYAEPANVDRAALREIIDYEWIVPGVSDGGAHTKFFTGGRYPTEFLSRIVREEAMCSLEHAHWRLSALPAHCAGFRDRGTLVEGAPADVVVYDHDRLACLPTEVAHDFPGGEWPRIQRAQGYRFVLVNREVTIEDDRETGIHPGRLLRHGAM